LNNSYSKLASKYKVKSETLVPSFLVEEDKVLKAIRGRPNDLLAAILNGTKLTAKAHQTAGPVKVRSDDLQTNNLRFVNRDHDKITSRQRPSQRLLHKVLLLIN
jgi:hypothetical protein